MTACLFFTNYLQNTKHITLRKIPWRDTAKTENRGGWVVCLSDQIIRNEDKMNLQYETHNSYRQAFDQDEAVKILRKQ